LLNDLWRSLTAPVIAGHGTGHIFFLAPTLGLAEWRLTRHSWLLGDYAPDSALKVVVDVVWPLAIAGFVAAGVGAWGQQDWWRGVAIASSAVSLLGLVLLARASQPFLTAGAIDVIILVAPILVHWPSAELVGSQAVALDGTTVLVRARVWRTTARRCLMDEEGLYKLTVRGSPRPADMASVE
jgi:hypothetical protein